MLSFILDEKRLEIKPRFTFKKKFLMVDGTESMQLQDLSQDPDVLATTPEYFHQAQYEIARTCKEEFLSISDDVMEPLTASYRGSIDQTRIGSYELPDGSKLAMSGFER